MDNNVLEMMKTIQSALNAMVEQQKAQEAKEKGYREVEKWKRNKAELITCKEASQLYPIGESKFRELCKTKNNGFPSITINSRTYILKNKLDDWLYENCNGSKF